MPATLDMIDSTIKTRLREESEVRKSRTQTIRLTTPSTNKSALNTLSPIKIDSFR